MLLKKYDDRGFVFFTNYASRKGRELAANPYVSLLFPWHPLARQVIVTGTAARVAREETVAYFRTRPHGSQLGAWASEQSTVIGSRQELIDRYEELAARYPEGEHIPAPPSGAASASYRRRSSSGRATRTVSTTGCGTYARVRAGEWNASAPDRLRTRRNPRALVPPCGGADRIYRRARGSVTAWVSADSLPRCTMCDDGLSARSHLTNPIRLHFSDHLLSTCTTHTSVLRR